MVVVDTSVAYKWFSPEKEEFLPQALGLLKTHLQGQESIIAPDLIVYELANAWATKTKLATDQIQIFLRDFKKIRIRVEPTILELIGQAVDFSRQHQVSVYDASYAVLAREKKCSFFTADSKFVKRINLPFVKHLNEYVI